MKRSQEAKILAYLQTGHTLTAIRALKRFGSLRLAARVNNLREQGHKIRSCLLYNRGKRYSIYWLNVLE